MYLEVTVDDKTTPAYCEDCNKKELCGFAQRARKVMACEWHSKHELEISKNTLDMMDKAVENIKKGKE
jgi:hypothetical protein